MARRHELADRIYRALIRLYPPSFRREYGPDLVHAFRDHAREARHHGGRGRLRLAAWMVADLGASVPRQWVWWALRRARRQQGGGMGNTIQDLRGALRSLTRRPAYTLTAVGTLAVGIAGATTIFSIADGIVLRPLPYPDADRLVQVGTTFSDWDGLGSVAPAEFAAWRRGVAAFESVAASRIQLLTVHTGDTPDELTGAGVSGDFFQLMGARAARGRLLGTADDDPDGPATAVLTHGAWLRRFGADDGVLGSTVSMDGTPFTIVGVLPASYRPPEALYQQDVEVYIPLTRVADDVSPEVFDSSFLQVVARLRGGMRAGVAAEQLHAAEDELLRERGVPPDARSVGLRPLQDRTVGEFGHTLLPFLAAVGLLLLVACANVANLSLIRATERGREMAVRAALGAGRARVVRQLLTESLVTALAAGALGAALAWGSVALFHRFAPPSVPRAAEVAVDGRVLAFGLAVALVTGLLFGLAPVLHVVRARIGDGLRDRSGLQPPGMRLRSVLVVGEIAFAVVLVVGGTLLVGSLLRLMGTDLGFRPSGAAYMTVMPEGPRWDDPEQRLSLYRDLATRVAALPGVTAVGGVSNLPLGGDSRINITVEGYAPPSDADASVSYHRILPGFFQAAGIRVLEGRSPRWNEPDAEGSVSVVVNRAMARRYWPGQSALGRHLHLGGSGGNATWMTVRGVVGDVRQVSPGIPPEPQLYLPYTRTPSGFQVLVARTGGDPATLVAPMRRILAELAPDLPARRSGTLASHVAQSLVTPRFYALILATLAGMALVLALVGVYGTMAYAVRTRTRELGVRMALGAGRGRVRAMVLGRGMRMAMAGVALGLLLALGWTRLLASLVYGVSPDDPVTLAAAGVAVTVAAVLASWIPAMRATQVDPARALRAD